MKILIGIFIYSIVVTIVAIADRRGWIEHPAFFFLVGFTTGIVVGLIN